MQRPLVKPLGAAAVLALGVPLVACADQPRPYCISTVAPFAVKLLERSRSGACGGFGSENFNTDPEVGLGPFYASNDKGQPDYAKGSLAIRTAEIGSLYAGGRERGLENLALDGDLYSRGDFATGKPDDQGFCAIAELSLTHLVMDEVPAIADDPATADMDESVAPLPALDVSLRWSNVRVYVTPASFGTQMDADLVDARLTPAGESCEISYKALGLAPAVPCAAIDEDGAPLTNADGSPQLDPAACNSEADPAAGRVTGSGISPNAAFECDPVTAFCMIAGEAVPSLR